MRAIVARLAIGAVMALAAASAAADDWGALATISSTLGINANRLCLGEGVRASDIGCPGYAPYVSNSGGVRIGTAAPSATLHLVQIPGIDTLVMDTIGNNSNFLRIKRIGTEYGALFNQGSSSNLTLRATYPTGNLIFQAGGGSVAGALLSSAGNFGIGTTSPTATLQVSGSVVARRAVRPRRRRCMWGPTVGSGWARPIPPRISTSTEVTTRHFVSTLATRHLPLGRTSA